MHPHQHHHRQHAPEGPRGGNPQGLSLGETHRFVAGALAGRRRVLEVGCGSGALAARLGADGFQVTALDVSLEHLEVRGAPGVVFLEKDFMQYQGGPFDAVLFVTSLHHLADLPAAVALGRSLLVPGGLLVAEEFALEAPDLATARWYFETQELLAAAGLYPADHLHGSAEEDPLERWAAEHVHAPPLHPGMAMVAALQDAFQLVELTPGPYLYRYLCGGLEATARGEAVARAAFESERRRIAEGTLRPVGLRLVARA